MGLSTTALVPDSETDCPQSGVLAPPFEKELLGLYVGGSPSEPLIPILPATYRHRYKVHLVDDSISSFLDAEFDVSRLNKIHKWLWLCGLPSSPRPLHYQLLKNRQIVVSEQLDLHLIWSSSPSRIFIKPLPRYLLSPRFWRTHICPSPHVYQTALGFILSYAHLIERESDFKVACEYNLLPAEISWPAWLEFMREILLATSQVRPPSSKADFQTSHSELNRCAPVNPRFFYGELRLGRLNWIHRLFLGNPRGYLSGCTTYGAFVRDNINSLITLFAYTTIVLSAMQVGLGTQWLADDYAFGMASYVFSIFSIVAPLAAIVVIFLVLGVLFVFNLLHTLHTRRKRRKEGANV